LPIMVRALEIATLLLVAVAWSLVFAHAAELPGKMRLDRDTYLAVQGIYYPGFTFGGASEPLSILALIALLAVTPLAGAAFWLTALALAAAMATHAIFWFVTQPVNRMWVKDLELGKAGAKFFSADAPVPIGDWTRLRDRWELSHLVRAIPMSAALVALILAVTT
jgi:hypothetical protein